MITILKQFVADRGIRCVGTSDRTDDSTRGFSVTSLHTHSPRSECTAVSFDEKKKHI